MKNIIKLAVLLTALATTGYAIAADHGERGKRMHQRGGPDMGMQVIEHLTRAIRRLDLSEEQKDAIRADMQGFREDFKPLVKQVHENRKALHELITADSNEDEAVSAIASQLGQLTEEMTLLVSDQAASILDELDEEQRAELKAMGDERRAHRAEHRAERQEKMMQRRESRRQEGSEEV